MQGLYPSEGSRSQPTGNVGKPGAQQQQGMVETIETKKRETDALIFLSFSFLFSVSASHSLLFQNL